MGASLVYVLLGMLYVPRMAGTCCSELYTSTSSPALVSVPVAARKDPSSPKTKAAKGQLLVASRSLGDPNFSESVILLLAYEAHGAMGVVINRPSDVRLASVLTDVPELRERPDRVFLGGPVSGNLMVFLLRSTRRPDPSEPIFADVYATGSLSALRQGLSKSGRTAQLRAYAGYAGWGPGQLEREIARGDWYLTGADAATIFDTTPSDIWPKLIERTAGQWTRRRSNPRLTLHREMCRLPMLPPFDAAQGRLPATGEGHGCLVGSMPATSACRPERRDGRSGGCLRSSSRCRMVRMGRRNSKRGPA